MSKSLATYYLIRIHEGVHSFEFKFETSVKSLIHFLFKTEHYETKIYLLYLQRILKHINPNLRIQIILVLVKIV